MRADIVPANAATSAAAVLTDSEGDGLLRDLSDVSVKNGPIVSVFRLSAAQLGAGGAAPLDWLMNERTVTVNTTAAGGNASLMSIG